MHSDGRKKVAAGIVIAGIIAGAFFGIFRLDAFA